MLQSVVIAKKNVLTQNCRLITFLSDDILDLELRHFDLWAELDWLGTPLEHKLTGCLGDWKMRREKCREVGNLTRGNLHGADLVIKRIFIELHHAREGQL